MIDMVFFGIIMSVYLLIGLILTPIVFADHIKKAETDVDSTSSNICAAIFVLALLWPFAYFIKKYTSF